MMIDIKKKYRCQDSNDVEMAHVGDEFTFGTVEGAPHIWYTKNGLDYGGDRKYDLIEVKPYENIEIDTPVWVRPGSNQSWVPRHFAGVGETGLPRAWDNGTTSHTANGRSSVWHELTTTKPEGGE